MTSKIKKIEEKYLLLKSTSKTEVERGYDVIELFKDIINLTDCNRKELLHTVYDGLIGEGVNSWFKKTALRGFAGNIDFLNWYTEKLTNPYMGTDQYISETLKVCFSFPQELSIKVAEKNFGKYTKSDFKNKVLPLIKSEDARLHIRYKDFFCFYLKSYVSKKDTFKELVNFSPENQVKLLSALIKMGWFDEALYSTLKSHFKDEPGYPKILSSIFKHETNLGCLEVFKEDLKKVIYEKKIGSYAFFKGVNSIQEKPNYIFNNLIIDESDFNKALDNALTSKANAEYKKDFLDFLDRIFHSHVKKEKELTETQCIIILKRCYDCGQAEKIYETMNVLEKTSLNLFNNVKNLLRSAELIEIYPGKSMDFTKKEMKKFFIKILNNCLINELTSEPSQEKIKKVKI